MSPKQEALAALSELNSVRQTIGALCIEHKRCKPGSKRWSEIYDTITRLENQACELSSKIRTALWLIPDDPNVSYPT